MRANKFQFYAENHDEFTGNRDLTKVREVNPTLESFAMWLDKHREDLKATQTRRNRPPPRRPGFLPIGRRGSPVPTHQHAYVNRVAHHSAEQ
jgi:hypothetical protein